MGKTTWQAIRRYRSMVANDYFLRSRRPCEWWNLVGFYSEDIDANCVLEKILVGVLVPEMGPWEQCEKYLLCIYIYILYFIYTVHMYAQFVFAGYLGSAIVPSCRVWLEIAKPGILVVW